ncbi:MAG: hypothetical protein CM15mP106_7180 [Candidatus Neomarinimicrobiota bacterium]|nr:MAG: hypothetical protein CM15mP106_7180 [Candidatus Neomarinimicrobiota bacterium]
MCMVGHTTTVETYTAELVSIPIVTAPFTLGIYWLTGNTHILASCTMKKKINYNAKRPKMDCAKEEDGRDYTGFGTS